MNQHKKIDEIAQDVKDKEAGHGSQRPEHKEEVPAGKKTAEGKEAEFQELQRAVADYKDKYIRLYAEFDNARKRHEREKAEFIKYANEGLMIEFLNILDDLERSVDVASAKHQDYTAFLKGVEMIMAQLYEMLKRNGLKPIEAVGRKFDPHRHEVLMQVETDEHDEGTVVEEFQKGYSLGERVIRTAKVKVAVNRPDQDECDKAATDPKQNGKEPDSGKTPEG